MSSCNYNHLIYDKKNTIETNNKKIALGILDVHMQKIEMRVLFIILHQNEIQENQRPQFKT